VTVHGKKTMNRIESRGAGLREAVSTPPFSSPDSLSDADWLANGPMPKNEIQLRFVHRLFLGVTALFSFGCSASFDSRLFASAIMSSMSKPNGLLSAIFSRARMTAPSKPGKPVEARRR
jgi:hypothetical protein